MESNQHLTKKSVARGKYFDFNLDVYGEYIEITFKSFIRNEKKFKNLDSLKKQIRNDIKIAEQYFKNE